MAQPDGSGGKAKESGFLWVTAAGSEFLGVSLNPRALWLSSGETGQP